MNKRPIRVTSSLDVRVGKALREMRESMGLAQVDAADAMGCSQATMSRMEAGKESISLVMLERRANAMGLEVEISFRRRAVVR